jgi:hypothetical protein
MTDGIRSSWVNKLKFCVETSLLHSVYKITRHTCLLAGRACNVHKLYKSITNACGRDM